MSTENRSSNTEMVSVPKELLQRIDRMYTDGMSIFGECEELRAILTQPAEQHQGEPVAWRYQVRTGGQWYVTTTEPHARMFAGTDDGASYEPLYTHADPGEVERLSQIIRDLNEERDELGASSGRLRAQLAERDALLAKVVNSGALSSEHFEELEAECCAITANAPKCKTCHDQGEVFVRKGDFHYSMQTEPEPVMAACPECAEPSEPVERDERAEFEAEWRKRYPDHPPLALKRSGLDLADYCNTRTKDAWWAWQARAALERKP